MSEHILARRLLREPRILAGSVMVLVVGLLAIGGSLLAPFDPTDFVGRPFRVPSAHHWLGTDILGRDVLSILLTGGGIFLAEGIAATVIGVGLGLVLGVSLALLARKASDVVLTVSDIAIVLPQVVVALLILTRLGTSPIVLIGVIGFVHVPQTARVIRAASLRVVTTDYFQSARLLGARWSQLLTREIMPNIHGTVAVEVGIRLAISLVVLASLSYLGFGTTRQEWGRMIHDNQGGLAVQPWSVIAPVTMLGVFLIGANLVREGITRTLLGPREAAK
jgi:peptide/nickel transport system permease protein